MNLSLSVSLLASTIARLRITGPVAAAGWVLVPAGPNSFEIQNALGNGLSPPLSVPQSGLLRIGTETGWSLSSSMPGRLRILQALSNSPAPTLSVTGSDLILIGA